ncbi:peptidase M48-like protein [Kribbella sp. VKM Ac-2527]|uniref:Peptidase M48-like protein n=1 Tax=Kribbella caucasensis TaxID=2512215 RepID=A0A4R6JHG5_9ACTN|nr:M56 family metallopeptidase [Kribbella sp. VKM Ac-2527]TDO35152.1 peptidase M48-like protein [Kribbella sp. VKM Ac-2527]
MTLAIALFGYAALVATLAPRALAGAWRLRSPRLTMTLWHASAASVLVSLVLAAATCVTSPGLIQTCIAALVGDTGATGVLTVAIGLLAPVLLLARLTMVAIAGARRRRADRRRHLELLSVLGRHDSNLGVLVVSSTSAAAYCVPGTDKVVLTSGALHRLEPAELRAALAHERAHLAGRHHLLVAWAGILANAFPGVPVFRDLLPATANLVELLADDRAVRRSGRAELVGAIAAFTDGVALSAGLAATGGQVSVRVERLLDPAPPLPLTARLSGAGVAATLVALPGLLAVLLAAVAAGLAACPLLLR